MSLAVSHAFHSPLMEPMVATFRDELDGLEPQPARFPLFSTVLGRQVDGAEMTVDYWARQICSPVLFFDAVQAAASRPTLTISPRPVPNPGCSRSPGSPDCHRRYPRLSCAAARIPRAQNCSAWQPRCCATGTRPIWLRCTASRQVCCCGFRPMSSTTHTGSGLTIRSPAHISGREAARFT